MWLILFLLQEPVALGLSVPSFLDASFFFFSIQSLSSFQCLNVFGWGLGLGTTVETDL
jgi:hypothetical protein